VKRGKLIVFCGPSGSGKGTVEKEFLNDKIFNFHFSISDTTREKRESETHGVNYSFLTKEEFKQNIKENKYLEWAKYINNYYGTPIAPIEKMLAKGQNVFLEIELLGVKQVVEKMPEAITIFLSPPSVEELEKRLKKGGTESIETINRRIEQANEEIKYANDKKLFKYNIINYEVEETVQKIKDIISSEVNA